jgi:hypothetical protein
MPAASSDSIERCSTPLPLTVAYIVAPNVVE